MAAAKLMVMYPPPKDVQTFERVYLDEHVPMAVKKLAGKTKIVATKVQSSPQGKPPSNILSMPVMPTDIFASLRMSGWLAAANMASVSSPGCWGSSQPHCNANGALSLTGV